MNRWLLLALTAFALSPFAALADGTVGNYQLIEKERIEQTVYRYTYKASLTNTGAAALDNPAYALSAYPQEVRVVDGELSFPSTPAGGTTLSSDTFTIVVTREEPIDTAALVWETMQDGPSGKVSTGFAPLQNATLTLYDRDGKLLATRENATNQAGQFTFKNTAATLSKIASIKAYGGNTPTGAYQGELVSLCVPGIPDTCNITPYTFILSRLSALYSNPDLANRAAQAQALINEVLQLDKDFSLYMPQPGLIDVSQWEAQHGNGRGDAAWYDSLISDVVDGYLDKENLQRVFIAAKLRPTITESFSIDAEALQQQLNGDHLFAPATLKIVSFSNSNSVTGGSDISIDHQDYISGISAIASIPTGYENTPTVSTVLYQSFNLGKWKGKLNSETTVLYNIFLRAVDISLLPSTEKLKVAELIAATSAFQKAVNLYEAGLQLSDSADLGTLETLLNSLAYQAKDIAGTASNNASLLVTSLVTARMSQQDKTQLTRRTVRSSVSEVESVVFPNDPDSNDWFTAFDGMQIVPRTNSAAHSLEFYSDVAIWYGLHKKEDYSSPNSTWQQHLFDPSLIYPQAGFVDFETVQDSSALKPWSKRTDMPIANVDSALSALSEVDIDGSKIVNMMLFRNNPNSLVDAPQLMNMISALEIAGELLAGLKVVKPISKALEGFNGKAKLIEDTLEIGEKVKPVLEAFVSLSQLLCSADFLADFNPVVELLFEDKLSSGQGLTVQDCNQRFGNLNEITGKISGFINLLPLLDSTSDAAIAETTTTSVWQYMKSAKTNNGNIQWRRMLKGIATVSTDAMLETFVEELFVKPIITPAINSGNIDLGAKCGAVVTERNIARSLLKRYGFITSQLTTREGCINREAISIIKLVKSANALKTIETLNHLLFAVKSMADYFHNVQNLLSSARIDVDVNSFEIVKVMGVELWRFASKELIKENGAAILANALASLTPAKVVHLVSGLNKGGAMAWDYATKPSAVALTMRRVNAEGAMEITRYVPELYNRSYLSFPLDQEPYILGSFSSDKKQAFREGSYYFLAGGEKNANYFLVMSGINLMMNQAAFVNDEDADILKSIIHGDELSTRLWHSYRHSELPVFELPPDAQEITKNNAFCTLSSNGSEFCNYELENLDTFGVHSELKNCWELNDYVSIGCITQNYMVTHNTPGIFSDFIQVKIAVPSGFNGTEKADYYDSYAHIFVLPDYLEPLRADLSDNVSVRNINDVLKAQSRIAGNILKLRLNIGDCYATNTYWGNLTATQPTGTSTEESCTRMPTDPSTGKPYPGIKDYPFYMVAVDDGEIIKDFGEVHLGHGGFVPVSIEGIPPSARFYVYDSILKAWEVQTHVPSQWKTEVIAQEQSSLKLKPLFEKYLGAPKQPFMTFTLDEIKAEYTASIKIQDISGTIVSDAKVTVYSSTNTLLYSGNTDANGIFGLPGIQNGEYSVLIYKPGEDGGVSGGNYLFEKFTVDSTTTMPIVLTLNSIHSCANFVEEGNDEPEIHHVLMNRTAGTFPFTYNTYSQEDQIKIYTGYTSKDNKGTQIFDSGCVGKNETRDISYISPSALDYVTVEVVPNCAGGSGTDWRFNVACPYQASHNCAVLDPVNQKLNVSCAQLGSEIYNVDFDFNPLNLGFTTKNATLADNKFPFNSEVCATLDSTRNMLRLPCVDLGGTGVLLWADLLVKNPQDTLDKWELSVDKDNYGYRTEQTQPAAQ